MKNLFLILIAVLISIGSEAQVTFEFKEEGLAYSLTKKETESYTFYVAESASGKYMFHTMPIAGNINAFNIEDKTIFFYAPTDDENLFEIYDTDNAKHIGYYAEDEVSKDLFIVIADLDYKIHSGLLWDEGKSKMIPLVYNDGEWILKE